MTATSSIVDEPAMTAQRRGVRSPALIAAVLALAALFAVWAGRRLGGSLWLDEFVATWAIRGGTEQVVERATRYLPHSPLYYLLLAQFAAVFGTSEPALRLPSLLFSGLSLWVVFRTARTWCGPRAALAACVVYASAIVLNSPISFDVGTYSLALCGFVLTTSLSLDYVRTASNWSLAGVCLCSVLTVYSHYLFALSMVVPAAILLGGSSLPWWKRLGALGVVATVGTLSLIPAAGQLSALAARSQLVAFAPHLGPAELVRALVDVRLAAVCFAVAMTILLFEPQLLSRTFPWRGVLACVLWYAAPPVLIFLLEAVAGLRVNVERYMIWRLPAPAALVALAASRLNRDASILTLTLVASAGMFLPRLGEGAAEDWRSTIGWVRRLNEHECPVLLYSRLVETRSADWLRDPGCADYLTESLTYYRSRGRAVALPYSFFDPAMAGELSSVRASIADEPEVFVVCSNILLADRNGRLMSSQMMVGQFLIDEGFQPVDQFWGGTIVAMRFRREASAPSP